MVFIAHKRKHLSRFLVRICPDLLSTLRTESGLPLYECSTSVFYFNKLFLSKSRANIAWIFIGYTRVITFTSFSARWTVVMFIKSQAKMHLDDLGFLELVWWEDIFTAINLSSTHRNSDNNEKHKEILILQNSKFYRISYNKVNR